MAHAVVVRLDEKDALRLEAMASELRVSKADLARKFINRALCEHFGGISE